MRVAITGASGFLGQELAHCLLVRGERPILLARRPLRDPLLARCAYLPYTLEEGIAGELPDDCGAIVHCAFQMGPADPKIFDLNVRAAASLREIARERSRPRQFVFISSMAAHADARSRYGRAKWAIERELDESRDCIVRPGLIVGNGGLFGRIKRSIDGHGVVPLFDGGKQLFQVIWVGDLARAIADICAHRTAGTYNLGSAGAITFKELCKRIAKSSGKKVLFLPCPARTSILLLRALEKTGLRLPVTSENLTGLLTGRVFDTRSDAERLGLSLADLDDALLRIDSTSR